MPKTRPLYAPESGVRRCGCSGAGIGRREQLAHELGCSAQTRRNWWRQEKADPGERVVDVLTTDERARLRHLKRENRVLRQEREILKRAAVSAPGRAIDRDEVPVHGTRRRMVPDLPALP